MEFKDRLKKYREELGIDKKRDMANKLEISESFYNLLESGTRPVSKNVLNKLVVLSKKPEEYWRYGITDEKDFISKREDFKCLKDAIVQLTEIGLLKDEHLTTGVEEVLIAAMKADVTHLIKKMNLKKEQD